MHKRQYDFLKLIGKGGQGDVYLCLDKNTNQYVCIKRVCLPAISEKFGVSMLRQLHNPGFVKTIEFFEDEEFFYHVMPYIEGKVLSNMKKSLNLKTTKQVGLALMSMVAELNEHHLTFNDIKPDNVILENDGNIRLIDIGAILKEGDLSSRRYGSIYFASYEYLNKQSCNWKSDIYSIARTLLYVSRHNHFLLKLWIKKATYMDPHQRFKSIQEAYRNLKYDDIKLKILLLVFTLSFNLPGLCKSYFKNIALSQGNGMLLLCIDSSNQLGYELLPFCKESYLFIESIRGFQKMDDPHKDQWIYTLQQINEKWAWELQKRWYRYPQYQYRLEPKETFLDEYKKKEDVEYYMNYVFYTQKETLYPILFKKLEKREDIDDKWRVELAYRMKDLELLKQIFQNSQCNYTKANCLYSLFMLGNYDSQLLKNAMILLEKEPTSNLYQCIQTELKQWGESE